MDYVILTYTDSETRTCWILSSMSTRKYVSVNDFLRLKSLTVENLAEKYKDEIKNFDIKNLKVELL